MLAEIEQLDRQLAQAEAEATRSQARCDTAQEQLRTIEAAAARSRSQQADVWQQFRRRVRALARLPPSLAPTLLQGADSFAQAIADARLLRAIAAHDRSLHDRLLGQSQTLATLEAERQAQQGLLRQQATDSAARRQALAQQRQARQALLKSFRAQRATAVALGAETTAARAALGAVVERPNWNRARPHDASGRGLSAAEPEVRVPSPQAEGVRPLAAQRGRLVWPASGPVRVAFGERIDLAYGTVTAHNGWDIGAPAGSRVQAVAPGRVVYADWLRGYGQVVIVDHADAYHAVVAHLASVHVAVGDQVTGGQVLGTVGDTGSLRGPVLYFELRHRGAPVDPRDWLRRAG
jgi:septal ring factor EnvC (AmiA/AmiB activator)